MHAKIVVTYDVLLNILKTIFRTWSKYFPSVLLWNYSGRLNIPIRYWSNL